MATAGKRVQAVDKAVELLDFFWKERRAFSVTELAQRTGSAKSSVHTTLSTLLDHGLVMQNPKNGKYYLGYHAYELGCAASEPWEILPVAEHYMRRVVDEFDISLYLGKRYGSDVILLKNVEPYHEAILSWPQGARMPLFACAQGKCILAQMPEAELAAYLRQCKFEPFMSLPDQNAEDLRRELNIVRVQGYALSQGLKTGLKAIGAPIFDREGRCDYGLAVVTFAKGPLSIALSSKLREIVIQTARSITEGIKGCQVCDG